ncbi:MAG: hypothetical protein U0325_21485 [Polyangiales bacterium]
MRRALSLALVVLAGAGRAQPRPPEAPLRLHFHAPSSARYAAHSVQRATVGARESRIETRVRFSLQTDAVSPAGEAARALRVTEASLDAEAFPTALRARLQRALAAVSLRYRESPRGEVSSRALQGADDPALRDVLASVLQSFDAYLPVLPEGPVAVGARWSAVRELGGSPVSGVRAGMRCEAEYTLRALRPDGAAVLDLQLTLRTPEGALLAGVPMRGEGQARGEAVVDLAAGLVREARVQGVFTARLTVRGQEVVLPSRFEDELRLEGATPPRPRGGRVDG